MSEELVLSRLEQGACARVRTLRMDDDACTWLRALGLFEGQRVSVLRRAPFGGPFHVRTGSGGEFAIDPEIAQAIGVAVEAEQHGA